MAKYKPCNNEQMVMLPISLENQLQPGTLEHTIHEVVEKHIDTSVFDARYRNDESGARAIHPKVLLKVILFAYSRGETSSRRIERACAENVVFMALASQYVPDHSTIAHFVSSMQPEIEGVFSNVLLVCEQLGLLGGTHFSLDGVKLSANVSKEWSGTFDELKRKRDKLQEKLRRAMEEHAANDREPERDAEAQKKRERRLQLQVERLNRFLEKEKPKQGSDGKEIQSNAVDNESAKLVSSHGVIQGYNAQALVDSKHQVIVAAEASATQDHENLKPMLAAGKKNLAAIGKGADAFEGKVLTADSNYHSLAGLTVCRDERVDAYIPDTGFRQRDPRFAEAERFKEGVHGRKRSAPKRGLFSAADFKFDAERGVYVCPNGKALSCHARNQKNRYRVYDVYEARAGDCAACPLRSRCLSRADASRRYLSVTAEGQPLNLIDEMKAKIDSEGGRKIYARRLGIVEPVFANVCVQKKMSRFTLRKKRKVDVQWKLYAMVHNIGKICVFGGLK